MAAPSPDITAGEAVVLIVKIWRALALPWSDEQGRQMMSVMSGSSRTERLYG